MDLPKSRAVAPRLEFLDTATSTNDLLREAASGADASSWPHGSVIVTDDQTNGRGRLGRTWLAPTGKTLAISVLLRPGGDPGDPGAAGAPALPSDAYGWIPLIAGAAMTEAVTRAVEAALPSEPEDPEDLTGGIDVRLKWPNDVLVSGYKVCGILSELLPETGSVIVGAGLNLTLDEHDLPTLTSTSLLLATGVRPDADAVLADYLETFARRFAAFAASGGDADASGIAAGVSSLCGTLGSDVRVELPGDRELIGTAERLDGDGRLVVRDRENGEEQTVAAGDVTHLRY